MTRTWLNLASLCVLLTLAQAAFAQQLDEYCHGKRDGRVVDNAVARKYEQSVGFNPEQYIRQTYASPLWTVGAVNELEKFRIVKLKDFITQRGASVLDVPAVLALASRSDAWTGLQSGRTALARVVRVYEERAEVDCKAGSYTYSVEFLTPKNPLQLLSYPLRTALDRAVEHVIGKSFSGGPNWEVRTFRVDEIVERVRTTLASDERVLNESTKPESALPLLHPRFRQLFPLPAGEVGPKGPMRTEGAEAFAIGEYRLSPEMSYVIEQVLRRFLRTPEAQVNSYNLIVRGYADKRPVREIAYEGICEINNRVNAVSELTSIAPNTTPTAVTITSNTQLSIARGCEGARFAKGLIPPSRRIRVFYSGASAGAGALQDLYRGIELRLERSSPTAG